MLILLMVCAIGYSQTDAKSAAAKAPVAITKQQKKSQAVQQQNEPKYKGSSATDLGIDNPKPLTKYGATAKAPIAYFTTEAASLGEEVSGMGTTPFNPNRNIPFTGTYGNYGSNAAAALVYDNGSHFNIPGPPPVSMLQDASLNMSLFGFGAQFSAGNSMADDMVLTGDFNITSIDVYAYQTGSTPPTINAVYLQVWDGDPSSGGASVIWGDLTTNIISNGAGTGAFRQLESAPGQTNREIQVATANTAGLTLTAGTYWIEYTFGGSGASGPWAPPIVITGNATTGNALQNLAGVYGPAMDAGSGTPQGMPFQVYGDPIGGGGVCGNPMIEVNQDVEDTCMANIAQTGLAQSYIPLEAQSAGAGIKFTANSTGLDVELSLWDGLPNAGGTMLASGITQTDGTAWADVYWDPVVNVTVGDTYYIVIDGDVALPCVAGSVNDPYPDGNVFANAGYTPFPTFDYTFRTYSCDGGGGGVACSESNASNNFENGFTSSNNTPQVIAADVTVDADTNFSLDAIQANWLVFDGEVIVSADITIYGDLAGLPDPSNVIATLTGVVPTSQTVIGDFPANPALDALELNFDISPVMLNGQAGNTTTYWISIYVDNTSANSSFWENSTASTVGNDGAFSPDAGVTWAIALAGSDQVYEFSGICEPIGGGPTCTSTAYDSTAVPFDIDGSGNQTVDCANAPNLIPVTIADAGTIGTDAILENITIDIAHTFTADLDMYLVSPNGTELLLANDLGGGTDDGYNGTMFEDGGADITLATAPFGVGPYEPMGGTFAAAFAGEDITGDWNLKICDDAGGDTGQVLQFSMSFCVPPVITNDDCANAYDISCGDSVVGETLTATDSGGNPAPDVFFKFTGDGSPQLVTISLCAATDYDSLLRVFDDCNLANELAVNDDSCGLQSELTFSSDGTSTYYIMVEGFGSNAGNFSLDVTCTEPLPNDECSGAIAVSCGDSITGTTDGATVDTGVAPDCGTSVTSPGVWYSLDDNSGLPGTITLSLCNGTDYDSKISVYTGDCSAPPLTCVDGNDDSCGLQSEVTFNSDGNTTYLILVHGFGGATGNFTLDVTCTPTPPPNDMIVNSIDVDEIGFPYTDPAVAMPAATTENGNPVGCDLTGANGVWYNFVAAGDGTANAMIVTPGGASSVTFYTAPNENATETDLTLVQQQSNQCGPGTSASIFTLAGQAYYVFVLNSGAVTDIVIDGTNLGVSDNAISGFSYYPNPSNGVLNLQSVDNIEHVSLYNLLGQRVLDNQVNATESKLDVSGLSTGTYLMKVTVNGQIGTYKVLKQ